MPRVTVGVARWRTLTAPWPWRSRKGQNLQLFIGNGDVFISVKNSRVPPQKIKYLNVRKWGGGSVFALFESDSFLVHRPWYKYIFGILCMALFFFFNFIINTEEMCHCLWGSLCDYVNMKLVMTIVVSVDFLNKGRNDVDT